jgi:hypothetical protein
LSSDHCASRGDDTLAGWTESAPRQEYYADYFALDNALVSLEIENNALCFMPQTWESQVGVRAIARSLLACEDSSLCPTPLAWRSQSTQRMYDRIVDGIGTVLLTLKKRPVIRYSQTCARR